jgi:hypothetical protein
LARHGGAGAKGLMDQIEKIGTSNTNPWVTIKCLEVLRDMVEVRRSA